MSSECQFWSFYSFHVRYDPILLLLLPLGIMGVFHMKVLAKTAGLYQVPKLRNATNTTTTTTTTGMQSWVRLHRSPTFVWVGLMTGLYVNIPSLKIYLQPPLMFVGFKILMTMMLMIIIKMIIVAIIFLVIFVEFFKKWRIKKIFFLISRKVIC